MKDLRSFKIRKKNRWFIGRDISPVVEWPNRMTVVYKNELFQYHREDGPAVEYSDDKKAWYENFRYH